MRIPAPAGFPGLEDLLGTTSDDSKDRCASLLRALTDLYLQRPVHTLEDDHYYTELALRLIDSADVSERATLAARLAACPSAPLPVLKRLARDTIEVAGPILQHLPHLRTAEFESPTAADTRAHWQIIASGLQRTQPAARRSHHAHQVGPSELSELFYRATAPERRLILINLEYALFIPTPSFPSIVRTDIWRLEAAALHKAETLTRELERLSGVSQSQARRIINDELGEPIVITAKAINLPKARLQRLLLVLSSCLGQWADRLHELTELYEEISTEAARKLIGIWREAEHGEGGRPRYAPCHLMTRSRKAGERLSELPRVGPRTRYKPWPGE